MAVTGSAALSATLRSAGSPRVHAGALGAQGTPVGAAAAGSMEFLAILAVRTATESKMVALNIDIEPHV